MTRRALAFWLLVGALAGVTHLRGLGAAALWQDEAETAVLARNVLRFGLPRVDDGVNFISQNQGRDHDPRGLWNYTPWLALYLAAGSFGVLGESAFAARLPFALCALGALFFVYRLSRRWSGSAAVARVALGFTLASVPWLLHARQCRWYGLAAFLSLYLWWSYEEFLDRSSRSRLHLIAASVALFHANFLIFLAVAGGVALHFLAAEAPRRPVANADARAALALFFALTPGIVYFRVVSRAGGAGGVPVSRWENLRELAWGLDGHVFPLLGLAVVCALARRSPRLRRPLALFLGGAAILAAGPHFFFRYLVVFIPLAAHLAAEAAAGLWSPRSALGAAWAGALLGTNLLSVGFWLGLRPFLRPEPAGFLAELSRPPRDPVLAAAALMGKDAKPGDLALVSYPDLSFMFHTPLGVIGGGSGKRPVRADRVAWIVVRSPDEKAGFPVDWSRYEAVTLDAPNGPWGNRPEPDFHAFRTRTDLPPAVIYRRKAS